jgi:hypothetical protein
MSEVRKLIRTAYGLVLGTLLGLWAAEGFSAHAGPYRHVALGIAVGIAVVVVNETLGQRKERKAAERQARIREAEIIAEERLRERVRAESTTAPVPPPEPEGLPTWARHG